MHRPSRRISGPTPTTKSNKGRWRCLTTGCNPILNEASAKAHADETEHRVATWPVRSSEGKRRAKIRNRTGYYDKYNVGYKSAEARGFTPGVRGGERSGYVQGGGSWWDE